MGENNSTGKSISIHQPSYWPWLGLLYKIANSEIFVFLEDVAANKAGYQYRNIFYCDGEPKFLSLPVNYSLGVKLNQLEFKNYLYIQDHLNKLKNYYMKASHFEEGYDLAKTVLEASYEKPSDLLFCTLSVLLDVFDIRVTVIRSTEVEYSGQKDDLVLDICEKMDAGVYIAGMGGLNYMDDMTKFINKGIELKFYKFSGFEYPQNKKFPFLSGLSTLDLIMFNGIERSKELFWENFKNNKALERNEIV